MDVATILAYLKTPAVWLSRKVVNMAIGPRLRLEYNTVKWPRCREFVMAQSEPGASLWSPPATGALLTPESTSNALYIRTHVTNYGHLPARECVIFVERIYREGQLIETEESPIIWTDLDPTSMLAQ